MTDKPLISFDFAIKYLLKNKGDYDIIEGFISALFAAQGYPPVKINALLDSESAMESRELKKSIADLVVEDIEGNKYIVEIDRAYTPNFVHKACFNTSRLVVDSISGNQDYTNIKKVFHISLLYFNVKILESAICHAKTIMHQIDTAHPIDVRIANQGLVMFNSPNILPEYFFISVPKFNNIIHQEIDEWLYVMKNSDVKKDFKSPYMAKVASRLAVLKMNDQERNEYFHYLKEAVHSQDTLNAAKNQGIAEGKLEGEINKSIEIALEMLSDGQSIDKIVKYTKLTEEQIKNLKTSKN